MLATPARLLGEFAFDASECVFDVNAGTWYGQPDNPHGVAADSSGSVRVTDETNN